MLRAGTAASTLFAHFADRDYPLAALLAESLHDDLEAVAVPMDRRELMQLLDRVYRLFAADAEMVALLVRFSGSVGKGLALHRPICLLVERLAIDVAGMQARGEAGSQAKERGQGEALMALIFHASALAPCGAQADAAAVQARAGMLLVDMAEALPWP